MNIEKSTDLIIDFLKSHNLWDFLCQDPNIYIGGSLPFMCLSKKITNIVELKVGDIDIYTKNCPLLFRNINKRYKISNIIKTGVNVKFNIDKDCEKKNQSTQLNQSSKIPIQIITSPFEDFKSEVLDEYDCGMVAVGFHPANSEFIIHPRFTTQLEKGVFEVIHERSNHSRVKKLTDRAYELFDSELVEIKLNENSDYRSYWKNKKSIDCINDVFPSPPYTQLYAAKYHCIGCGEKQKYLICRLCQVRIENSFISTIKSNNFVSKYKSVVVFGGLNGLGKIMADEIIEIGEDKINLIRTGRDGGKQINTYPFDLTDYIVKLKPNDDLIEKVKIGTIIKSKKSIMEPELINKIIIADLVIFNSYQTLEGDQSIWNTNLNTFNAGLSEHRFKINCWGYVGLIHEILEEKKKFIKSRLKYEPVKDQIFVWIDANESRFDGKLSDGKHLELNMAKTACKQIFYTNANVMAGLGILFLCYDCGWCSYHGISVDKIASKSSYLVPPKLTSKALIAYLVELDIDKMYQEKKFIHDITFYKCVENLDIDFNKKITHFELDLIVKMELNKLKEVHDTDSKFHQIKNISDEDKNVDDENEDKPIIKHKKNNFTV